MIPMHRTGLAMASSLATYIEDPRRIHKAVCEASLTPPPLYTIRDLIAKHKRQKATLAREKWIRPEKLGSIGAHDQTDYKKMMTIGSASLLAALWRSHPAILNCHEAAGRQVVRP